MKPKLTPAKARKMLLELATWFENDGNDYDIWLNTNGYKSDREILLHIASRLPRSERRKK